MTAIEKLFARLKTENKTAFMPFVTAGDPDLEFTRDLLVELDKTGCSMVELGFPYSDPIADGPVIQESYTRALAAGVTVENIFTMVGQVSSQIEMPIVSMVSFALIFRFGTERFIKSAKSAGISGAIVPDLPIDESEEFAAICASNDFNLVQLITPTTPNDRAIQIAQASNGFIYYVSVSGITGVRNELPPELANRLEWLKKQTDTPVCVGFGISGPDQAQGLLPYADGIIVGSAIVKRMSSLESTGREQCQSEIAAFADEMVKSLS